MNGREPVEESVFRARSERPARSAPLGIPRHCVARQHASPCQNGHPAPQGFSPALKLCCTLHARPVMRCLLVLLAVAGPTFADSVVTKKKAVSREVGCQDLAWALLAG